MMFADPTVADPRGAPSFLDPALARAFLIQLGNERRIAEQQRNLAQAGPVLAFAKALEARCAETAGHVGRIAAWSQTAARSIGLDDEAVEHVRLGAYLHDVGKVGVPDSILWKAAQLSEEEWPLMRAHPLIGEKMLAAVTLPEPVRRIVRHHHERFDGAGYPDGLYGAAIPVGARIVPVADAFDAMCSDRPYRDGMTAEAAASRLRGGAGTQFDPDMVEVFLTVVAFESAQKVQQENGRRAKPDRRGRRRFA